VSGPLSGIKIVEFAGLGPGPFCGMLLSDLGADVVRIDRAGAGGTGFGMDPRKDILNRGRRSIAMDLKRAQAVEAALRLLETADALIEGFRPGVMERLGLAPDKCLTRNPKLVYGRMTGWGQTGPLSSRPGHDINYIALSGVLSLIGRKNGPPIFPLNLVGDMGGGGLLLAFGLICGILEARSSGLGQVVDAAMLDGAVTQLAGILAMRANGLWKGARGYNAVDTGSHFYEVYETADRQFIALGAVEPVFYRKFCETAGLTDAKWQEQMSPHSWPALKAELTTVIKTKTRDEWVAVLGNHDTCVTPVLEIEEAVRHPHVVARSVYTEIDGVLQPSPAPRFDRTPGAIGGPPPLPGEHSVQIMREWGFSEAETDQLIREGVVA
jgi:alpha-methylacyl-CoA racemase